MLKVVIAWDGKAVVLDEVAIRGGGDRFAELLVFLGNTI